MGISAIPSRVCQSIVVEGRALQHVGQQLNHQVPIRMGILKIYLRNPESDFELELTVNKGRKDPYSLGDGYGHLAVAVDDIDGEHKRFSAAGFNPRDIVEFNRDGELMAKFFFVEDPDGYKIEVLQKHGRYR